MSTGHNEEVGGGEKSGTLDLDVDMFPRATRPVTPLPFLLSKFHLGEREQKHTRACVHLFRPSISTSAVAPVRRTPLSTSERNRASAGQHLCNTHTPVEKILPTSTCSRMTEIDIYNSTRPCQRTTALNSHYTYERRKTHMECVCRSKEEISYQRV